MTSPIYQDQCLTSKLLLIQVCLVYYLGENFEGLCSIQKNSIIRIQGNPMLSLLQVNSCLILSGLVENSFLSFASLDNMTFAICKECLEIWRISLARLI